MTARSSSARSAGTRWRRAAALAVVALTLGLTWHYATDLERPGAADGERQFIIFGEHSFRLAFVDRTLDARAWARDKYGYGARNPHLGKYLVGGSLYAHGFGREDVGTLDHFRRGAAGGWERVSGVLPAPEVVAAARLPVALTGVGTCLLLLAIGRILCSFWTGLVACALLATDELFRLYSRVVLTDVPEVFFACLALLALLWSVGRWDRSRRSVAGGAALVGVAVALAVSTKLRALLALASALGAYLLGAVYARLGRRGGPSVESAPTPPARALVTALLVLALIVPALFVAMNPFLYDDTIARTGRLLSLGNLGRLLGDDATPSAARQRHQAEALETPGEKLYWLWRMSFVDQGVLARGGPGSAASPWHLLGVLLTAAGLAGLARAAVRDHRAGRPPVRACFLFWVVVSVAGVLVWTPFRWPRYYLYLFPVWALLIGRGVELAVRSARSLVARVRHRAAAGGPTLRG